MPHQCINCGEVFLDGSMEIINGCPVCGGKKFVYVGNRIRTNPVPPERTPQPAPPRETKPVQPEAQQENPSDIIGGVESVRVLGKGNYEFNLERMANSQEVIIGVGTTGKYMVDLPSMSKDKKKRNSP